MDKSNQRLGPNALEHRGEGKGTWGDELFLSESQVYLFSLWPCAMISKFIKVVIWMSVILEFQSPGNKVMTLLVFSETVFLVCLFLCFHSSFTPVAEPFLCEH